MKLVGLIILGVAFFFGTGSVTTPDGSGEFHISRRHSYDLTVSIQVTNGKVQKISYSEWTPVNRSAHECGFDAARDDGDSKWTDHANTTTVVGGGDDYSTVTITSRADGLLVQSRCDKDLKILFAWRNGKYMGRLLP